MICPIVPNTGALFSRQLENSNMRAISSLQKENPFAMSSRPPSVSLNSADIGRSVSPIRGYAMRSLVILIEYPWHRAAHSSGVCAGLDQSDEHLARC